jgi:glycosyltransferase involved in cell wall biosynthesis
MPEISVIIPSYQHAATLPACLDSIFAQTWKDIEVIVVNDGSTDGTAKAVEPYLPKIKYIETPNSGAQKSRNRGFDASSGRFVIFCDADVVMKPRMLEKLRTALTENPEASYAYGGFRFGWVHFRPQKFDAKLLRRVNYIHTSALIRRDDFPRFDESLKRFHDWDLWLTMLRDGKIGVAVMETLFRAKPRKGGKHAISEWLPKFLFSPVFPALGVRFAAVEKYRAAAAVIAAKHHLALPAAALDEARLWPGLLAVFVVSALGFAWPSLGTGISIVVVAVAAYAASRRLLYGASFMLLELIIGSLSGRTLSFQFPGYDLPLRIALFAAVGLIWIIRLMQRRVRCPENSLLLGVGLLLGAVGWGIANGFLRGLALRQVFFDANAYLALPMILIFASAVETEEDQAVLKRLLRQGAIAISVLTVAAFYFFSHRFPNQAGVFAYKWLRDSRIAEITALGGGWYRVFVQSQLFCLLALLWAAIGGHLSGMKKWSWLVWVVCALLISGSRSYALGIIAAAIAFAAVYLSGSAQLKEKLRDRMLYARAGYFIALAVVMFAFALRMNVPPNRSQQSFQDMLLSRSVSERDAATASRWALLEELNVKIGESPILGSGFGASVTYESSDPRIISTTGGTYTTSAFEWGYHDILVKMGLLGLLAYGYLLYVILRSILKAEEKERAWLLPAFLALLAVNVVSPYLNHPLGIGYLALLVALAERKSNEPVPVGARAVAKAPALATVPTGVAMSEE